MRKLILLSLITWRLSSLLVREDGPDALLARARDVIGVTYDERSRCQGKNAVADGLCCLWCTSVWIGWIIALLDDWKTAPLTGLAYSAGAILLDVLLRRYGMEG